MTRWIGKDWLASSRSSFPSMADPFQLGITTVTLGIQCPVELADESVCPTEQHSRNQSWADEGVGCGPGGPPHKSSQAAKVFRSSSTYAQELPTKWRRRFRLRTD